MLMSGGTGFLMSWLARRFLEEGYEILFLVRLATDNTQPEERMRQQLGDFKRNQWRVIAGDTTKPLWGIEKNDLSKLKGEVTELWHGAAAVSFNEYKREAIQQTNVEGTRNTIEVATFLNVPLHYISTAYIAHENVNHIAEETPVCRVHLRNVYEETKCDAELFIHQWQKEGKGKAAIYRPAILIGDSRTGEAQGFTGYYMPAQFLATIREYYWFLIVPYAKNATLNLIPVDWAAGLIKEIARHPEAPGKIFHITHPDPPTIQFLFFHAFRYFGISRYLLIPTPAFMVMTITKIIDSVLTLLPFRATKRIQRQFLNYVPYFVGEPRFSQKNVERILGRPIMLPPISKAILGRCLDYAIAHNFKNTQ